MKKILFTVVFTGLILFNFAKDNRPNILWIISEDMSQDQACYGNPLVKTPTLDKLAKEGMRFTNMFTIAAVCSPSRTALATGMYQTSIGAMHMRYSEELMKPLPEGIETISHILEENGYQTLGVNTIICFASTVLHFSIKILTSWKKESLFLQRSTRFIPTAFLKKIQ